MQDIDLQAISSAISLKLGKTIELISVERIGSGFHAVGYKVTSKTGKHFFIKKVHTDEMGFEFPERKLSSLLIGHSMANRSGNAPRSIGIIVERDGQSVVLPDLDEKSSIYSVQEFEQGGAPYNTLLEGKMLKRAIDAQDLAELEAVTDYIAKLHSIEHHTEEDEHRAVQYKNGLRSETLHPELVFTFMHDFEEGHPFLPPEKQREYVGLIIDLLHHWKEKHTRLRALHGDFWGANVFLRPDNTAWVIDYSRVPWGDPGIDIGRWMSQYLWFYHSTGNPYFKELGEAFLDMYVRKTGDSEIRDAASLGFVSIGVLYAMLGVYPEASLEVRERMFNNIIEILRSNKFHWSE